MLQSLRDLMGARLQVGDREGYFRDAFFRIEDGMLRYVAIDIGGWLNTDDVIVSMDLMSPPDPAQDDAPWQVRLSEAALEGAPRWTDSGKRQEVDLRNWPPVIVGPFGGTLSPILLYEQVHAAAGDAAEPEDTASAAPLVRNLQRAGKWLGLPAFDASGELGRIRDMEFDPDNGRILAFVLEGPGPMPSRGVEIPYRALRHLADGETHLVFGPAPVPSG